MIAELAPGYDLVDLRVPMGLRLRDSATGNWVGTGLSIGVERNVEVARRYPLDPTPSGHWVNQELLNQFRSIADNPDSWAANTREFRFSVDDPSGQFLPLRLKAKLPVNGTLVWSDWPSRPATEYGPLVPAGSAANFKPPYLPLFPTSAYNAGPLARVYAHLMLRNPADDTKVNAAWALVTVTQGGKIVGVGLSDAFGSVGIYFPYPLLPDLTPQQKTQGRAVPSWDVTVAVYSKPLGKPDDPTVVPDLKDVLDQLALQPRLALKTTANNLPPLGTLKLEMGKPLVLRSESPPGTPKSSLYLNNP